MSVDSATGPLPGPLDGQDLGLGRCTPVDRDAVRSALGLGSGFRVGARGSGVGVWAQTPPAGGGACPAQTGKQSATACRAPRVRLLLRVGTGPQAP